MGLKQTEGSWETELNEYFSSISLLLSSQLQVSETVKEKHTKTPGLTHRNCAKNNSTQESEDLKHFFVDKLVTTKE